MKTTHKSSSKYGAITLGVLLVGGLGASPVARAATQGTDEEARQAATTFLKSLGVSTKPGSPTIHPAPVRSRSASGKSRWLAGVDTSDGQHFTLYMNDGDPPEVGILDNVNRAWDRARGKGRTEARFLADASAAQAYVTGIANRLRGTNPVFLDEIRFKQNSKDNPGSVFARFLGTVNGHPLVDRFHGVLMEIDAQDGAVLSLRQGWRLPPIASSEHTLTADGARSAFLKLHPKASQTALAGAKYRLRYAVPPGETRARLVWVVKTSDSRTHIDACTGKAVMTSPLR